MVDQAVPEATRYLLGLQELVRAPFTPQFGPAITGAGGSTPTIVIAASNTSFKTQAKADYVSPSPDTTETMQVALQDLIFNRGGGRIVLTEGDFYLPRTTTLAGGVAFRFEGMGQGNTRLHSAFDGSLATPSNQTMFEIDHTAGTGVGGVVTFEKMTLDGHKAIQTSGTPHGIYVEPNGTTVIGLNHVTIQDFRGTGAYFDRCADDVYLEACMISGNQGDGIVAFVEGNYHISNANITLNTGRGIKADGANLKLIGTVIHDNGGHGFSAGGNFESLPKLLIGNAITSNGGIGIEWDGVNGVIADNYIADNASDGITAYGNFPLIIKGNTITGNTLMGVTLTGGAGNRGGLFDSNVVRMNGRHGIYVASDDWKVQGNHVTNNSRTTTNTYDGIHVASGVDVAILTNMLRQTTGAPVQRYGLNVTAGATGCWYAGNDARGGGWGTADYVDAGTASINVWAGGTGDNQ